MPKKVYNNVEDHRLLDGKTIVEDITSVTLPTINHPTTSMSNISGLAGDIDMPNPVRVEAMEFTINHNNGVNCNVLSTPNNHDFEFRVVGQVFDVAKTRMGHNLTKYRIKAAHKGTDKGTIEAGNPRGSTERYSVLRYEEIDNGKQTVLIDIAAGIVKINGKSYTDEVQNLLK